MVLDGIEDVVDGVLQRVEVLSALKAQSGFRDNQEHLLFEGMLPPILVVGMGRSFELRVHLLPIVAALERVVDEALLQLDVALSSGHDFTHPSDVMLQQVLV